MAPRLFVRPDALDPQRGLLDADAARHVRALRLAPGDRFVAITGPGCEREATLVGDRGGFACILGAVLPRPVADPRAEVTLAVAIADPARLDLVVEKSVELGATRVLVFRAERSQRDAVAPARLARWQRIARAACEQCGRTEPPSIELGDGIAAVVAAARVAGRTLVFAVGGDARRGREAPARSAAMSGHPPAVDPGRCAEDDRARDEVPSTPAGLLLVVGPEGGLTGAEVAALVDAGAQPAGLGPRVLRFETAAIAALARHAGGDPPPD